MAGSHLENSIEGSTRAPLQAECEVRKVVEFSEELAETSPPHGDSCWESIVYTFILKHVICKAVNKTQSLCGFLQLQRPVTYLISFEVGLTVPLAERSETLNCLVYVCVWVCARVRAPIKDYPVW